MQERRSDPLSSAVEASGQSRQQRPSAAAETFARAVERVEQVIDQETHALRQHKIDGLGDFSHRKSHGLLELTRAMRGLGTAAAGESLEPRLQALHAKLKENSAILRTHLEAVQEVSAVMSRAIRDGESDGTYSAAIRFPGGKA